MVEPSVACLELLLRRSGQLQEISYRVGGLLDSRTGLMQDEAARLL